MLLNIGKLGSFYNFRPRVDIDLSKNAQVLAYGQSGGWNGGASLPGAWTAGGFTRSIETENVNRPGIPVMKFTMPSGATNQGGQTRIKIPRTLIDNSGRFEIHMYHPPNTAGSISGAFSYSSDTPANDPVTGNPTNFRRINFEPVLFTKGKWTVYTFHKDGPLFYEGSSNPSNWTNTGSPNIDYAEYLSIEMYCTAATPDAERWFLLDCVGANGYRKPFVMLGGDGFDYASHVNDFFPLMDARGFKGYIAGDGNRASPNSAALSTLYNAGWDIVSQGMNHTNYASNPSALSGDFDTARGILDGLGFTRASDWFMYPNSATSQATVATLESKGVKAARANTNPKITISELGNSDFSRIGLQDMGQRSAATMISWIDDYIKTGTGGMPLLHETIDGSPSSSLQTSKADLTTLLDYIKLKSDQGLIDVITPTTFGNRYF